MNETETSRILMVDDNPEIREVVNILLSGEGYEVEEAADGLQALDKLSQGSFDLIILDVMMPNLGGYQTCMEIRKISNAPVLFLSARSQVEDKTLGFSSGGDDYLPKPFSYQELLSRVKALMRRYQVYQGKEQGQQELDNMEKEQKAQSVIAFSGIEIQEHQERVLQNGVELDLTDLEFAILCLLGKNRGQIFSAQHLYESVWQEPYYYGAANTVMVHIRNLRKKIEEDPKNPKLIKNVWGKGYRCE
ncbi:MAG: response regulator transcription factor [Lachnospiraceae bacterium]|jgi:two-component system OmpR family response regulator|nr:response regulator transcription factor [Lachnospiraceae bacterium]